MRLKNEVPKRWNPENLNPVRKTEKKSPQKTVRRPGGQKPRKTKRKTPRFFSGRNLRRRFSVYGKPAEDAVPPVPAFSGKSAFISDGAAACDPVRDETAEAAGDPDRDEAAEAACDPVRDEAEEAVCGDGDRSRHRSNHRLPERSRS